MISGTISCVYIKPDNESKSDSSSGFFRKADIFFPASFLSLPFYCLMGLQEPKQADQEAANNYYRQYQVDTGK